MKASVSINRQVVMETKQKQKKILIIDDEENMRHMLETMLTRYGYARVRPKTVLKDLPYWPTSNLISFFAM
jgi:PleD family two-component response regulator